MPFLRKENEKLFKLLSLYHNGTKMPERYRYVVKYEKYKENKFNIPQRSKLSITIKI